MNELLAETTSPTQGGGIWGQLLMAAILILLVNAVIFLPKRILQARRLRRADIIPRVRGLTLSDLDENFLQLEIAPLSKQFLERGLRLAVAAQLPNDAARQVVTEPTPVPKNTLVIPRELAPAGSTLWVNWVSGTRVGPGASIQVPNRNQRQ